MEKYYYMGFITIILLVLLSTGIWFTVQKVEKSVKDTLSNVRNDCLFIVSEQKKTIHELDVELSRKQNVTVSFYHPASKGINSDDDPTNTAIMVSPIVGRTVAVSNELFEMGWLGQKIYIDGFGIFVCEDRMSSKIKGKCIDICVKSKKVALQLGRKHNIIAVRL